MRRVSVLDANKEHVERMRDPGLLLDELGEERHVRLDAHADPSDLEDPFDFALVTLKAPHLESALGPLVERDLARTFVSLGNGLVQDRIAAIVGDGPGFVANRIQNALFLEAVRCVEEGLASPQQVDEVVRSCFGFRLPFFGPFQISDMAGLDVYENVLDVLREGLGERFTAPESLRKLVEEGRTGTKSGAGFLQYSDEERERLLLERDRRYAALGALLEDLPPVDIGKDTP